MNPIDLITAEDAQKLTDSILALSPEMGDAMAAIRREAKTEEEALLLLMKWCDEHPEVLERLTAQMLAPLNTAQKVSSPLPQMLAAERAQFDGDVPEYRKGPLMGAMSPAVPVQTNSRSPVQIGMELEQASQKVKAEADALLAKWQLGMEQDEGFGLVLSQEGTEAAIAKFDEQNPVPQPEGYKAGRPAEMVAVVDKPSTLALTPEQRQKYAWATISTTQGRKSALAAVATMVSERLSKAGLDCPVREFSAKRRVEVVAHAAWHWAMTGRAELQPSFSFVDVAAQAIGEELVTKGVQGWLEAVPIDTVDLRKVGWACRIVKDT